MPHLYIQMHGLHHFMIIQHRCQSSHRDRLFGGTADIIHSRLHIVIDSLIVQFQPTIDKCQCRQGVRKVFPCQSYRIILKPAYKVVWTQLTYRL